MDRIIMRKGPRGAPEFCLLSASPEPPFFSGRGPGEAGTVTQGTFTALEINKNPPASHPKAATARYEASPEKTHRNLRRSLDAPVQGTVRGYYILL